MKNKMLHKYVGTAIMAGLALGFSSGRAAVVVDYDGTGASTQDGGNLAEPPVIQDNVELGGGNADDSQTRISLADNSPNPWSSTASSPAYDGPEFLAVWDAVGYDGVANWDSQDSDKLSIRSQNGGGSQDFHLAILFTASGNNEFDATSSLDIDLQRFESITTGRWLVRNDGTYYVSNTSFTGDSTFDNGNGLLSENWAVIDLAASADFDQGAAVFSTPTSALTQIDGFGFHAEADAQSTGRYWVEVNTFTATAIPEPGTMTLMGLTLLAFLGFRRWKRT